MYTLPDRDVSQTFRESPIQVLQISFAVIISAYTSAEADVLLCLKRDSNETCRAIPHELQEESTLRQSIGEHR